MVVLNPGLGRRCMVFLAASLSTGCGWQCERGDQEEWDKR